MFHCFLDGARSQLCLSKLNIPANVFKPIGAAPPAYMSVLQNLYTIEGNVEPSLPFRICLHPVFQAILGDQKEVIDKFKKLRDENGCETPSDLKEFFRGSEALMVLTQLNIISLNDVSYPTFLELYLDLLNVSSFIDPKLLDFTELFPNVVQADKRFINFCGHLNTIHLQNRVSEEDDGEEMTTTVSKTSISFAGGMVKDKRKIKKVNGEGAERLNGSRSEVNAICHVICETFKICLPAARSMGSSELAEQAWKWTTCPTVKQNDTYFGGFQSPGHVRDMILQLVRSVVSCGGYRSTDDLSGVVFVVSVSLMGALIRFFANCSSQIAAAKQAYAKKLAREMNGSGMYFNSCSSFHFSE